MVYVLRFITRNKDRERELQLQEIRQTGEVWHKSIQEECYRKELKFLRKEKSTEK